MTLKGILKNSLELLALATVAITQPILDLYGRNLPIFATAKVSEIEVAIFLFAVAVLPTLIAVAIEVLVGFIRRGALDLVHRTLAGLLGTIFGLAITRQIGLSIDVVAFIVSVGIGVGITTALHRWRGVRTFVSYISALAPLLLAVFVVQILPVFSGSNGEVVASNSNNPNTPIVLIVFDESPLFALLDAEGNINAQRFPGFARLASKSTWHRNALAVSQHTTQAVPAIFTSNIPKRGDQPFLSVHPNNIFTMLQRTYPINGYESVTSLCPINTCASANPTDLERLNVPRLRTFLKDATVVFGHRVLPQSTRNKLPVIGQSWGKFSVGDDSSTSDAPGPKVKADDKFDMTRAGGPFFQLKMYNDAINRMIADPRNTATILHLIAPHRPWVMLPDLRANTATEFLGDLNPLEGISARSDYQRYLYQLGGVDAMISSLIRRMEKAGIWDKSLVVVTADHGISFEPGLMKRTTDFASAGQVTDLFTIPMFVKMPQQSVGAVDDCAVTNLDLLPTIMEVSGVATSVEMQGTSLVNSCPVREKRKVTTTKISTEIVSSFSMVRERSDRYAKWINRDGELGRIAGLTAQQGVLGTTVTTTQTSTAVTAWRSSFVEMFENISDKIGQTVPVLLVGEIDVKTALPQGAEGFVTIDGKIAGIIDELSAAQAGTLPFTVMLDYTMLTAGAHKVSLLLHTKDNGRDVYENVGELTR